MTAPLRWFIVIVWMALIFYLSSIPGMDLPSGPEVIPVIIHFLEFFMLAFLLAWAINGGIVHTLHPAALISAFVVAVFYGIIDELYQLYVPGRVSDMFDILVDALGALTAVFLAPLLLALMRRLRGIDLAD